MEGVFVANRLHGYGRKISRDGSYYIGEWNKGKKHGNGKQVNIDDTVIEGEWEGEFCKECPLNFENNPSLAK